ncbi:MAG: hypothetical protein WBG63_06405, partial [Phormidesmis sp.]
SKWVGVGAGAEIATVSTAAEEVSAEVSMVARVESVMRFLKNRAEQGKRLDSGVEKKSEACKAGK